MEPLSSTVLRREAFQGAGDDVAEQIEVIWRHIKAPLIVPLLRFSVFLCLAMSLMLFIERLYMAVVIFFVKLFRRKPERRYKWKPIPDDVELGNEAYPMVLIQIPMYNEREVYKLSIGAACRLSWPSDRIIIQVLDDSTDPTIKELVEMECEQQARMGINIKYVIRKIRKGYKAGALREGLKHSYARDCDFVAIFDADFQPEPDFLRRAIPFRIHNPEIALVQARWIFVNADECLLTRLQEMSLDYHFTVEQEVGSSTHAFFGFNGSGGVWRISAVHDAGGWKERTTVEDMDLSIRASLKGWKFLYLGDLQVKSELPSTFKAFRNQQHRWSCGPANLFRKMAWEIIKNNKVHLWKKVYLIYSFFIVRRVTMHVATFVFYCLVIPATIFVPEVTIPIWGVVYVPTIITILNAVGTPRSFYLLISWIVFENVMSLHRTKATLIGLFEAKRANEWVVTDKLGGTLKENLNAKVGKKALFQFRNRIHVLELAFAAFLFFCASYDVAYGEGYFAIYLYLQAITFFIVGIDHVGTFAPNS